MTKPRAMIIGEPLPEVKVNHEVVFSDLQDERSVVNLVSNKVKEAIFRVVNEHPEWIDMNERELHKVLDPSDTDDKMRLAFWKEYNRAQDLGTSMKMVNIYYNIMHQDNFHFMLKEPRRVAWMIKPPEEYMISLEAALNHGKDNLARLMKMDLFDAAGNLKKTEANIFIKAYELLDNRVKGAVVQKIEQKTASLHVHKRADQDELVRELEELREKQAPLEIASPVKDE